MNKLYYGEQPDVQKQPCDHTPKKHSPIITGSSNRGAITINGRGSRSQRRLRFPKRRKENTNSKSQSTSSETASAALQSRNIPAATAMSQLAATKTRNALVLVPASASAMCQDYTQTEPPLLKSQSSPLPLHYLPSPLNRS